MTDKEKLLKTIEYSNGTFENIIFDFISRYNDEFSATRLYQLIKGLNEICLAPKLENLEMVKATSKERATYLKAFLEGKMYTTEESAIEHIPVQIKNAEIILETCKK